MNEFISTSLKETLEKANNGTPQKIVEIRVGSDSDLLKMSVLFAELNNNKVPYILRILSAHRTPEELMKTAQELPNIRSLITGEFLENIKICVSIAAAGGSAHIAGMTASDTDIPVIALPVPSSTLGQIDAGLSMLNMPPGIPNGTVFNFKTAGTLASNIYRLEEGKGGKIYLSEKLINTKESIKIIEFFGEELFSTDFNRNNIINIIPFFIDNIEKDIINEIIPVTIPVLKKSLASNNGFNSLHINKLIETNGLHQGCQIEDKINTTNSILFSLKILGTVDENVAIKLKEFRLNLGNEVKNKNIKLWNETIGI